MKHLFHRLTAYLKGPWGRTYLVTLIFVSLAAGLFWLDFFRGYESETSLLFLVQDGQSGAEVASSMERVMQSVSFYERVEKDFPGATGELTPAQAPREEKRSLWKKTFRSEVPLGTGVLTFHIRTPESAQTKALTEATVKTAFTATTLYYQGPSSVDVRVIEGPLFAPQVGSIFFFAAASFLTGLVVTSLFFALLTLLSFWPAPRRTSGRVQSQKKAQVRQPKSAPEERVGETVPWIDPKKFVPVRPSSLEMAYAETNGHAEEKESDKETGKQPLANEAEAPTEMEKPEGEEAPVKDEGAVMEKESKEGEAAAKEEKEEFSEELSEEPGELPSLDDWPLDPAKRHWPAAGAPLRSTATKAAAPGNLPVMEEAPAFQFGENLTPHSAAETPKPAPEKKPAPKKEGPIDVTAEPSAEEYKRRLNELLRGKPL